MPIKSVKDIKFETFSAGIKTKRQVLISSDEATNFAMRKFITEPDGEIPKHKNSVEHEQYVLNERAIIGIGNETLEVKEGDCVYIPAEIPHWYKTVGDNPFEFICIVPNKPDKMEMIGDK